MDACFRCDKTEDEVRLYDGIYINDTVKVCERCSLLENIPIIKLPSTNQLKDSEKVSGVYRRLKHMAYGHEEKESKSIYDELKELEKNPSLQKPEEMPVRLVDNFNWIIQHERRKKRLTQKQLANSIGESETAIKLIERNNLPGNVFPLIKKLEQFFMVRLIKPSPEELIRQERLEAEKKRKEMDRKIIEEKKIEVIENPEESPLGKMPSNEIDVEELKNQEEYIKKIKQEEENDMVREAIKSESSEVKKIEETRAGEPLRIIDFKKDKLDRITIADLREMQKKIEEDFPTKSSEEIGKEQLGDFGKEEVKKPSSWFDKYAKKKEGPEKVPTIHELMEKKTHRPIEGDKEIVGKDIEILEE